MAKERFKNWQTGYLSKSSSIENALLSTFLSWQTVGIINDNKNVDKIPGVPTSSQSDTLMRIQTSINHLLEMCKHHCSPMVLLLEK